MAKRRSFGQLRRLPSSAGRPFYTGPDNRCTTHPAPSSPRSTPRPGSPTSAASSPRCLGGAARAARRTVTSITLASYAAPWLADRPLKPRTREHYQSLLDRQILPSLGDKPLRALTPVTIRSWHAELGTKTPTLRAHAYGLLRTILATAQHDGLITANPCHIRGAGNSKRVHKIKPLTLPELEALVAAMPERHAADGAAGRLVRSEVR